MISKSLKLISRNHILTQGTNLHSGFGFVQNEFSGLDASDRKYTEICLKIIFLVQGTLKRITKKLKSILKLSL